MGGYLSLLAAGQRPQRVRGIVLLDSPIIHGWKSGLVGVIKATGQMDRCIACGGREAPRPLAGSGRSTWPFRRKADFRALASGGAGRLCSAWHRARSGRPQRCGAAPEIPPGNRSRNIFNRAAPAGALHAPASAGRAGGLHRRHALARGTPGRPRRHGTLTQGRISWIEGSHLFPFEQPGKTVDAVLGWIARLDRDIAA
jgi:pimeloyl-ACP methyl ester carboxylesterase